MAAPLLKKLGIKPGFKVLVLNPPDGYLDELEPLPENAELATKGKGPFDVVQLFVQNKAQVDKQATKAIQAVKPRGLLWVTYPKKSSTIATDISRDVGWEALQEANWIGSPSSPSTPPGPPFASDQQPTWVRDVANELRPALQRANQMKRLRRAQLS